MGLDYQSPQEFHSWYQTQLELGRSPFDVLEELARDTSPWSLCRRMCIAHWSDLWEVRDQLTHQALYSPDKLVEAYAVSFDAYREIVKFNTSTEGYNSLAQQYLPMLEGYIRKTLEGGRTPIGCEIEASLRAACGLVFFDLGNYDRAAEECSQAIYWIKKSGANFLLSKCRSLFVSIQSRAGRLDEALITIEEERKNVSRARSSFPFQERAYAEILFYLGHADLSLKLLHKLEAEVESTNKGLVQNTIERMLCLLGRSDGAKGVNELYKNDARGWLIESVGSLVKHSSLPLTTQTRDSKDALLLNAIKVWTDNRHVELSWWSALGQWVTGIANLWLGKTSSALSALTSIPEDVTKTQWLDLRILRVGLGLELSLHLNNPELNPAPFIAELRKILEDANTIKMASKKELLERFKRWHPLAAAFVAVMPDGIIELQEATRAIMQVGYRNVVHGISLPPAYMVELILRNLDVDRIPAYHFTQSDPGGGRVKRNQLMSKYGGVDYWLPTISTIRLIYGLKKLGYSETALKIANEYGVFPLSNAEYAMVPVLEHIGELTRQLLLDQLSVRDFASQIVAPD
jgi:tetratricopeptide (TPR) repeat protein